MNFNPLQSNYETAMRFSLLAAQKTGTLKRLSTQESIHLFKPQTQLYFTREGSMVIIDARLTVIYPTGIIFNMGLKQKNQLCFQKWGVVYCPNTFLLLSQYANNALNGTQYNFDFLTSSMTKSIYRRNILTSVEQAKIMNYSQFLAMLSPLLSNLIINVTQLRCFSSSIPTLTTSNSTYIGQIKQNLPNGYGALFSAPQLFIGRFQNGLLTERGSMQFKNHSYYFGQFKKGQIYGFGKFISSEAILYKHHDKEISQQQFNTALDGYIWGTKYSFLTNKLTNTHRVLSKVYFQGIQEKSFQQSIHSKNLQYSVQQNKIDSQKDSFSQKQFQSGIVQPMKDNTNEKLVKHVSFEDTENWLVPRAQRSNSLIYKTLTINEKIKELLKQIIKKDNMAKGNGKKTMQKDTNNKQKNEAKKRKVISDFEFDDFIDKLGCQDEELATQVGVMAPKSVVKDPIPHLNQEPTLKKQSYQEPDNNHKFIAYQGTANQNKIQKIIGKITTKHSILNGQRKEN